MASGHFAEARNDLSTSLAAAESVERDLPRVLPKARVSLGAALALHGAVLRRMGQDAEGQTLILRGRDLVKEEVGADSLPYRAFSSLLAPPAHVPAGAQERANSPVPRKRR